MINNESNDCMENDDDGKNEYSEHGRISNTNDKETQLQKEICNVKIVRTIQNMLIVY